MIKNIVSNPLINSLSITLPSLSSLRYSGFTPEQLDVHKRLFQNIQETYIRVLIRILTRLLSWLLLLDPDLLSLFFQPCICSHYLTQPLPTIM